MLAHRSLTIEQLLGGRPGSGGEFTVRNVPTRVYVPQGADWFPYWLRRVPESHGA